MQNNQDAINVIAGVTEDNNPQLTQINQQTLPKEEAFASGNLMLARLRGLNVQGAVSASLKGRPVLLIDGQANFDTGEVLLLCDSIDGLGVSEGTVTVEGWSYTKQS